MGPGRWWASSSSSRSSGPGRTPSPAAGQGRPITPELPPLIVVAGATATGKTTLGIELAQALPGAEIVSADSRQVYRGMDIATAKPTPAERGAARHHCLDLVDPDATFTVADYRTAALEALRSIGARDGIGLLVGGTGLYLRTIARGLPIGEGDSDPAVRAALETRLAHDGLERLAVELQARDADGAAAIDRRNPRRVLRALERVILTGSAHPPAPQGYAAPVAWIGLRLEPAAHRRRISSRIEHHFGGGLLDEAARLRRQYPEDLRAFSAMGYREAFDVLASRATLAEAKEQDASRTWAYARRQRTWFRAEPDLTWIEAGRGTRERALARLEPWLQGVRRAHYAGQR